MVVHYFLLGEDYHLGDLLWLTAVLDTYRQVTAPERLVLGCPDRPISRILEHNPLLDDLQYGEACTLLAAARQQYGGDLLLHDLRPLALALAMLRDWRYYPPWLYYRDLWLQARGQWLATFLHLGPMRRFRPVIRLVDADRASARALGAPYVVLAPRIGQYRLPLLGGFWRNLKGWPEEHWITLARRLRERGYTVVTLAALGQPAIAGTQPLLGLPIREAAAVIESATALISGESGLWFVAAACQTPFLIVPWWLPRGVDWARPMQMPHHIVYRGEASVDRVDSAFGDLVTHGANNSSA